MQLGLIGGAVALAFGAGLSTSAMAGIGPLTSVTTTHWTRTYADRFALCRQLSFGFELGLGWVGCPRQHEHQRQGRDSRPKAPPSMPPATSILKYFFASSGVRPISQGGVAVGIGATTGSNGGAGAGTGEGFGGIGLLVGATGSFYVYGSLNMDAAKDGFAQARPWYRHLDQGGVPGSPSLQIR